jgi:hypothetical protein
MTAWYLNAFLTSWRNAVNKKFATRTKASDGTIGDLRHQAESFSEHNPDRDGSVDAWDMDVNVLGSSNPTGNAAELAELERLKKAFQRLPEAQLWIHNRQIANRDIDNWKPRPYHGVNPHDHHVHWQSRSAMEKVAVSVAYLTDWVVDAINQPIRLVAHSTSTAPKWHPGSGNAYDVSDAKTYIKGVEMAQRRLRERGWKITIDGHYGPATARIVTAFQKDKHLKADGKLGPKTWAALWNTPIT